ncbi:hypothetical protein LCGC14_2743600 [marine sediment metagenome]|uniref:Uncharacterized protein n=1 Tax=marine sediment metagenome TaxID=412755 RepID=A0A0F9BCQ3_9ZZZZ
MTIKEFEVQKALGLAGEYDLTVNIGPPVRTQEVKVAVEKHTFASVCFRETYTDITDLAGIPWATLKFEVKCVHEVVKLIAAELHLPSVVVNIEMVPRNFSRILVKRLDMGNDK